MTTKEYETLARDMEESMLVNLQKMQAACLSQIDTTMKLCNEQMAAHTAECKQVAFGIFMAGGCIGGLIAAILLKVLHANNNDPRRA